MSILVEVIGKLELRSRYLLSDLGHNGCIAKAVHMNGEVEFSVRDDLNEYTDRTLEGAVDKAAKAAQREGRLAEWGSDL